MKILSLFTSPNPNDFLSYVESSKTAEINHLVHWQDLVQKNDTFTNLFPGLVEVWFKNKLFSSNCEYY